MSGRESWAEEFDFEYGENFAEHIEAFHPTFCKVQVRYNPEGNQDLNQRQSARLKRLSDYLHRQSRSLFLTIFVGPVSRWLAGKTTPKVAVAEIGQCYREFVNIFKTDRYATVG